MPEQLILSPSQKYLWKRLKKHSGLTAQLVAREQTIGPVGNTRTIFGYYLQTPLGDFGKHSNIYPISPWYIDRKKDMPPAEVVTAQTFTIQFDLITLRRISQNDNHLKEISFALVGLQEVFTGHEHMGRLSISILGLRVPASQYCHQGNFLFSRKEIDKYTRLWETERDARIAEAGLKAQERQRAREKKKRNKY